MGATKKFDGLAAVYTTSRPSYASELFDCLRNNYGISRSTVIADIGSGTGKFAKQLLDRGIEVFCVEPNADMRSIAESELCGYHSFHSIAGSAENTTLKSHCVDCITAAQAFHWFDVMKFKQECTRIVRNGGKAVLIWNVRDCDNIVNQQWHKIFSRYCPDFRGFSSGIRRDDERIHVFFDKGCDYAAFDYPLIFDRESFIKRSLSSSYSLKKGDKNYEPYISALSQLFSTYESNGLISVPNQTAAYIGTI